MKCHLSSRRILASKLNCIQLCSFAGHCFNLRISLAKLRLKKMNCRSTDRYIKKIVTYTNVSSRFCLLSFPFFLYKYNLFANSFKIYKQNENTNRIVKAISYLKLSFSSVKGIIRKLQASGEKLFGFDLKKNLHKSLGSL